MLHRVFEFADLKPIEDEVLLNEYLIADRHFRLRKALTFGKFNLLTKLKIMTVDGEKSIKSKIFELTEKSVRIKGNIYIPICSIIEVEFIY